MGIFKKATLATVLAATALTAATPAMARPYGHRSDNTGAVVAGGIIGLALINALFPTVEGEGPAGAAAFIGLLSGFFLTGIVMWAMT